jgi:hypothetical protein
VVHVGRVLWGGAGEHPRRTRKRAGDAAGPRSVEPVRHKARNAPLRGFCRRPRGGVGGEARRAVNGARAGGGRWREVAAGKLRKNPRSFAQRVAHTPYSPKRAAPGILSATAGGEGGEGRPCRFVQERSEGGRVKRAVVMDPRRQTQTLCAACHQRAP